MLEYLARNEASVAQTILHRFPTFGNEVPPVIFTSLIYMATTVSHNKLQEFSEGILIPKFQVLFP